MKIFGQSSPPGQNPKRFRKVPRALLIPLIIALGCTVWAVRGWWRATAPQEAPQNPVALRDARTPNTLQARSEEKIQKIFERLAPMKSKLPALETLSQAPILQPAIEDEFEGDVEKRREWFISQRKFPFDELPEQARQTAWASRPSDREAFSMTTEEELGLQWQSIGPLPTNSFYPNNWGKTSGRINAIAVSPSDPAIILIGAATGGVWRSIDAGTTFTPVSDNHVDLAVGSIAFAPSNSSVVYAGMGDKATNGEYLGTGVLRSSDAGVTWTRVNNNTLPSYGVISQILVDPSNANRVYVAQLLFSQANSLTLGGFYLSTDGGVNWTRTISGTARDLVRHPTQPNILYLALGFTDFANGSSGGIFKSTNSGQSWTRIYTSPFGTDADNIKIAVTPAAPQNLYVLVGKSTARLEVSVNEGGSWTNRGSNFDVGQFFYNCYLFVHPTNPNTIYVGTRDLWRSTNGGSTYTNITNNFSISGNYTPSLAKAHPDQHHFYISPLTPNTIYLANDGGLWKTTDGGSTFVSLNSTLSLTMFTSYDLHPSDPSRSYGGTQDNGTQKRTGTQSWREFATGDGGQTVIDVLDPSIIYTTYVFHTILRYTNSGDSFSATIGNENSSVFSNDRVAFYPPLIGNGVNSNLYFGTYRLFVSTNRGASWSAPGGGTDLTFGGVLSAIAVARTNTNVIYTGASDGRVMVSINGGASWTDRTFGLPTRFIKSITVSATDPNTAHLTVSGFGSGHVFKTTNAGATWSNISGNLPDIPTNSLLIDPRPGNSNTLYVGTDIGVFRSTVGGTTWETFNNGLPPTIISELAGQPGGLIHAGTYGRGAFEINLNESSASSVQYGSATYSVNENAGTATITITRSGTTTTPASVTYATANGTATSGQDYNARTELINFAAGETSKTFTVTLLDDSLAEGNETINLALISPTGATIGSPASAVLTIIDNEGGCNYALSPTSQNFSSVGGNGSFGVTTSAGCGWSAVSNASWLSTTSSGSGNGTVNFTVAANSGAARTGTISVGGQSFTVTQNAGGGGCPSTTLTPGQSVNGSLTTADCFFSGTTRYVDLYSFSGTAGQQIAVSMTSATFDTYLYLLNSSDQTIAQDDDGGDGTNSRIPAVSGFFTLPATGTYKIYATSFSFDGTTGSTGSYTLSIAGVTSCSYALSSNGQSFGASGGSGTFGISTSANCGWSAVSNAGWLTTNSSGSSSGTISYVVASNGGAARTATITVGGQVFTVTQSAGGGSCPSTTLSLGQTLNGTLTTSDCIFSGTTRYVDVYDFNGNAGQQISVTMNSSTFDTYLYLLDSGNQLLAEDDDGGGLLNSRIPGTVGLFTLPATGMFRIYATSYSASGLNGSTGSYTINLTSASSCSYSLNPTSQSFGASSGNGSITVTTSTGCNWTATSNASWLTTSSSGSGTGTANYSVASNSGAGRVGTLTIAGLTFTVNQAGVGGLQLSSAIYNISEGAGSVQVAVTRPDTAGAATVDYATSDTAALTECNLVNGVGSSRCDYATTIGTLRFAAGEASKSIFIPVVDDGYAEGNEGFSITLSNPTGVMLGSPTTALVTINDNETANVANPITGNDFFIRQQYIDFLGREPDPGGLAGWRNVLVNCGITVAPPCDRIEVSAGFFRSEEFQSRGYFIYRFFSALGRIPVSEEFYPDFAKVSGFLTTDQLEANKAAYVNEVMARADFQTKYGSTLSNPTAYVEALLQTVGLPSHPSKQSWINTLNASNTTTTRGQVLRQLVESAQVFNKYYNEAFVIMQYFGYLRRTADASYLSWINTMNQTSGDYRIMINGFMNSAEYRRRFGP